MHRQGMPETYAPFPLLSKILKIYMVLGLGYNPVAAKSVLLLEHRISILVFDHG